MIRKKRPTWVPVVAGLILKNQQTSPEVLVGRRPPDKNLSGLWEFPGGKIEKGESPEIAIKRELAEELGIDVEVGELKLAGTHDYEEISILLLFYEIRFWKGTPKADYHDELKWVAIKDLPKLTLPEANQKLLPAIMRVLNG
mgnify:CR=1 FL=1